MEAPGASCTSGGGAPGGPPPNDGGIVLTLFLAAGTMAVLTFGCVAVYAVATNMYATPSQALPQERLTSSRPGKGNAGRRAARLVSGAANVGNSVVHVLLVAYMLANAETQSDYWRRERELGGVEAPAALAAVNFVVGLVAVFADFNALSLLWNLFVVAAGCLVPLVWPRFLEEGLDSWPYPAILIWFCIFFMESAAAACALTWWAIPPKFSPPSPKKKTKK